MASRKIPASALSVSSALNYTSGADMARVNGPGNRYNITLLLLRLLQIIHRESVDS